MAFTNIPAIPISETELLDISNKSQHKLSDYADHHLELYAATGAFIKNKMLICGGDGTITFFEQGCYILGHESSKFHVNLSKARKGAASTVIGDVLWVLGGLVGYGKPTSSTEYISIFEGINPVAGPDMPIPVTDHAVISLNKTTIMMIGGSLGLLTTAKCFYYSLMTQKWTAGPSLMQSRMDHSAGIITDHVTQQEYVVVVGGIGEDYHHDSVEVLEGNEWKSGMPRQSEIGYRIYNNFFKTKHMLKDLFC